MSKATLNYLGPYRLLSVVNTSQHNRIWKAYHDGEGRPYAIKVLLEQFRHSREYLGYLKREYTVGSKLDHERIIRIHQFAIDREVPYLAMEWFAAANLQNRIRQDAAALGPLVPKIAVQAAEAVAVFNSHGWVHRDIKPANFLVSSEGDIKLIDFSLARRRKGMLSKIFPAKVKVQGTHSYMSPEQIRGEPADDRADLYSLGCTLFELVAGRPPFSASSGNELLSKHLRAAPPSLEGVREDVNPEFARLIRSAMAKDPDERPSSTEAFYQRLLQTPVFRSRQ